MQVKKELGFCLLFLVGCLDVALRYENAAMIKSLRPELHINTFWRAIDPLSSSSKTTQSLLPFFFIKYSQFDQQELCGESMSSIEETMACVRDLKESLDDVKTAVSTLERADSLSDESLGLKSSAELNVGMFSLFFLVQ
jgi:hypothetical protein